MPATWDPKFPEFAVDQETYGRTLEADPGLDNTDTYGTEPWTVAPATSHTEAFRYFDVRKPENRWMKRIGAPSELQVRFKATPKSAARLYSYFFRGDPEKGKAIFEAMAAAEHPWGEVGYPQLVEGKVEYRRRT